MIDNFLRIEIPVSFAQLFDSFRGLKSATAATSNMEPPKQGALRAGIILEDFAHGGMRRYCVGHGGGCQRGAHTPKKA
jgi:hypothetical protein